MLKYRIELDKKIKKLSQANKDVFFRFIEDFNEKNVSEGRNNKGNIIIDIFKDGEDYVITNIDETTKTTLDGSKIIGLIVLVVAILIIGVLVYTKFFEKGDPNNGPSKNIDAILSGFIYTGNTENTSGDSNTIIPKEISDYEQYLALSKRNVIQLYSSNNPVYSSFDPSDGVGNTQKVENIRNKYYRYVTNPSAQIGTGYLYVIASADNGMLSEKESIYLYFGDFGGHLYKKYSLDVPSNDGRLHLLYPLDKVVFTKLPTRGYDDSKDMEILREGNRQKILNTNNQNIYFFGFVSTSRQGKLEEVTIVYE